MTTDDGWTVLGDFEETTIPYVASAGASFSMILFKSVADAGEAWDYAQVPARALLRQAAALLLQARDARRGLAARTAAQAAVATWQAKRVASHIDNNLDSSLHVGDLAAIVQLSNSYFSRAFKGTFGQPPHAFILYRRIERAQQEMREGHQPLSQIALSCGFADQAHLARIFRRETGLTPSAWRRANRPAADGLQGDASVTN